jgi:hypothetical protein
MYKYFVIFPSNHIFMVLLFISDMFVMFCTDFSKILFWLTSQHFLRNFSITTYLIRCLTESAMCSHLSIVAEQEMSTDMLYWVCVCVYKNPRQQANVLSSFILCHYDCVCTHTHTHTDMCVGRKHYVIYTLWDRASLFQYTHTHTHRKYIRAQICARLRQNVRNICDFA